MCCILFRGLKHEHEALNHYVKGPIHFVKNTFFKILLIFPSSFAIPKLSNIKIVLGYVQIGTILTDAPLILAVKTLDKVKIVPMTDKI